MNTQPDFVEPVIIPDNVDKVTPAYPVVSAR